MSKFLYVESQARKILDWCVKHPFKVWILMICLVFAGWWIFNVLSDVKTEDEEHQFSIQSYHWGSILNFTLSLNFYDSPAKSDGSLVFNVNNKDLNREEQYLRIEVPSQYNITKVVLKKPLSGELVNGNDYQSDYVHYYNEFHWNIVHISNFKNLDESSGTEFYITLNAINSTSPNARFYLDVDSVRVIGQGAFGDAIMTINLGPYTCKIPCERSSRNAELSKEDNKYVIKIPSDYYNLYKIDSSRQRMLSMYFGLNVENKEQLKKAEFLGQIGIGIALLGLLTLFEPILEAMRFGFSTLAGNSIATEEKLKQLARMLKKHLITKKEFEQKKKKILRGL